MFSFCNGILKANITRYVGNKSKFRDKSIMEIGEKKQIYVYIYVYIYNVKEFIQNKIETLVGTWYSISLHCLPFVSLSRHNSTKQYKYCPFSLPLHIHSSSDLSLLKLPISLQLLYIHINQRTYYIFVLSQLQIENE